MENIRLVTFWGRLRKLCIPLPFCTFASLLDAPYKTKDIDGPCLDIELPVRERGMKMCSCYEWRSFAFHEHNWTLAVPTAHAEFDELRQPTDSWSQILNYRTSKQNETTSSIVRSPPRNWKLLSFIVFLFQEPSENGRAIPNQTSCYNRGALLVT